MPFNHIQGIVSFQRSAGLQPFGLSGRRQHLAANAFLETEDPGVVLADGRHGAENCQERHRFPWPRLGRCTWLSPGAHTTLQAGWPSFGNEEQFTSGGPGLHLHQKPQKRCCNGPEITTCVESMAWRKALRCLAIISARCNFCRCCTAKLLLLPAITCMIVGHASILYRSLGFPYQTSASQVWTKRSCWMSNAHNCSLYPPGMRTFLATIEEAFSHSRFCFFAPSTKKVWSRSSPTPVGDLSRAASPSTRTQGFAKPIHPFAVGMRPPRVLHHPSRTSRQRGG